MATVAEAIIAFRADTAQADRQIQSFKAGLKQTTDAMTLNFGATEASAARSIKAVIDSLQQAEREAKKAAGVFDVDMRKGTAAAGRGMDEMRTVLQSTNTVLQDAGLNTGVLGRAVSLLTNPLALAAAGIAAVGITAIHAANAVANNAKEIKGLMAVSGLGAEEADNLADTFAILGAESARVQTALFKMGTEIDKGGESLTRLGISIFDTAGGLKTEGALLFEVRDRISEMGSASQRSAALMELFGRSGRDLASVFAMNATEFAKYRTIAEELSPWNDELQHQGLELSKSYATFGLTLQGLTVRIGGLVVPAVKFFVDVGQAGLQMVNKTIDAFTGLFRFTAALFTTLPSPGELIRAWWRGGAEAVKTMFSDALSQAATAAVSDMKDAAVAKAAEVPVAIQQAIAKTDLDVAFARATQQIDLTLERAKSAAALGVTSASALARAEMSAIEQRARAEQDDYGRRVGFLAKYGDQYTQQLRELLKTHEASQAQFVLQREGARTKIALADRAEFEAVASMEAKQAAVVVQQDEAVTAAVRELADQRIAIHGTEEEKFVATENEKARVAVEKLYEVLGETETAADLGVRIQELSGQRIAEFQRQQASAQATREAEAVKRALDASRTESEQIEADYRDRFHTLDALRANELISERDFATAVQLLGQQTTAKLQISYQQDFNNRVAGLARTKDRVQAFYADTEHERLAVQAKEISDGQQLVQTKIGWLTAIANQEHTDAIQHQQQIAIKQQIAGHYFEFLGTSFALVAAQSNTLYQGMTRVAQETFGHLTSFASDFLFDFITGTLDAKKAFENFGRSMLRTITDFLAQQAVKQFLNFGADVASNWSTSLSGIGGIILSAGSTAIGAVGSVVGGIIDAFADFFFFSAGGFVPEGRGTDTVPAMLTPGEFVIPEDIASSPAFAKLLSLFSGFGGFRVPGSAGDVGLGSLGFGTAPTPTFGSAALSASTLGGIFSAAFGLPSSVDLGVFGITAASAIPANSNPFADIPSINPSINTGKAMSALMSVLGNLANVPTIAMIAINALTFGLVQLSKFAEKMGLLGSPNAGLAANLTQAELEAMGFATLGALINTANAMGIDPDTFVSMNQQAPFGQPPAPPVTFDPFFGFESTTGGIPGVPGPGPTGIDPTTGIDVTDMGAPPSVPDPGVPAGPGPGPGDGSDSGTGIGEFSRGGIARVHDGEVMTPRPFAQEFPALSRALERREFSGGRGRLLGDPPLRIELVLKLKDPAGLIEPVRQTFRAAAKSGAKIVPVDVTYEVHRG
jgi:hypothetical protein